LQIIETFEKTNQLKLNYSFGKRRQGKAPSIYVNVSAAENLLGWKEQFGLEAMVSSA
jgi:UDP-glucose 4-epimerase